MGSHGGKNLRDFFTTISSPKTSSSGESTPKEERDDAKKASTGKASKKTRNVAGGMMVNGQLRKDTSRKRKRQQPERKETAEEVKEYENKDRNDDENRDDDDDGDDDEDDVEGQADIPRRVHVRESGQGPEMDHGDGDDDLEEYEEDGDGVKRLSYIEQWERVIQTVFEAEDHLFDSDEQMLVSVFMTLSVDAKELFIKLMMRKIKIERLCKLSFPRITDINAAATELHQVSFTHPCLTPSSPLSDYMALLTKDELVGIARDRRVATGSMNVGQSSTASNLEEDGNEILRRCLEKVVGPTIKVSDAAVEVFQRLFIVYNREQQWPDNFFLSHIRTNLKKNALHYVPYTITRLSITWPLRSNLNDYIDSLLLERQLVIHDVDMPRLTPQEVPRTKDGEMDVGRLPERFVKWAEEGIEMCSGNREVWESWVRTRIMEHLAYLYGRLRRYPDRIEIFSLLLSQSTFFQRHRGYWYDELASSYHASGRLEEAVSICKEALEDPIVQGGHRRNIEGRLVRLNKKLGKDEKLHFGAVMSLDKVPSTTIVAEKVPLLADNPTLKATYLHPETQEPYTVEALVLSHYESLGFKGHHSENSIITTLFGLLFWDVIFDDTVPGVFVSPFQDGPLDSRTEFFYQSRKEKVDERLGVIREGGFGGILGEVLEREGGKETVCAGVNWRMFEKEDIMEIAECFGGDALARICEEYCKCYWTHCGGVPDLCVWNLADKKVKLVEVKGEGDRLAASQKVWLEFLLAVGVDVEVFHVALPPKEKKRRKKRASM
ncbi:hypothetical protein HDU97_006920 [Phlyctochytrium planicorne]|nr:hypothetical protein HDU97_006920 [Phlyctochytrium planicorne]